jgi:hypothetical protein
VTTFDAWSPEDLFGSGEAGFVIVPELGRCYTDTIGGTVAAVGDVVAAVEDISGNANHWTAAAGEEAILRQNGVAYYLELAPTDMLSATDTVPAGGTVTLAMAYDPTGHTNGWIAFHSLATPPYTVIGLDGNTGDLFHNNFTAAFFEFDGVTFAGADRNAVYDTSRVSKSLISQGVASSPGMRVSTGKYIGDIGDVYALVGIERALTAGELTLLRTWLSERVP